MKRPDERVIATVLREHRTGLANGGTATGSWCECSCGERNWINSTRDMAANKALYHVAAAVADRLASHEDVRA
jgi:hypothetical protein